MPRGVVTPYFRKTSLPWYSWMFIVVESRVKNREHSSSPRAPGLLESAGVTGLARTPKIRRLADRRK